MNEKVKLILVFICLLACMVLLTASVLIGSGETGILSFILGAIGIGLSGGGKDLPAGTKNRTVPTDTGRQLRELGELASRTAKEHRDRLDRIDTIVDDSIKRTESLKERSAELRNSSGGLADAIRKGIAKGKK